MSKTQDYKLPRPERPRLGPKSSILDEEDRKEVERLPYSPSSLHERVDTPEPGSMYSLSGVNPRPNAQLLAEYSASEYKSLISEYIKKQMIILGPVVAVEKARKVEKIKVKDDGSVYGITGEGEDAMKKVEGEYENMMGSVAHAVLLRVIDKTSVTERETDNV